MAQGRAVVSPNCYYGDVQRYRLQFGVTCMAWCLQGTLLILSQMSGTLEMRCQGSQAGNILSINININILSSIKS